MKQKIQLKTPITYYGEKQKMPEYILPLIPEHRIYSEAFFGGGAVFWAKEPAKVEFINDHNGEVINFYRVLKNDFAKLKQETDRTLHSEFQHRQTISIYQNPNRHDEIKRAWAVWVLSHQSFYSIFGSSWKCSKSRAIGAQIHDRKESLSDSYSGRLERTSIFCRDTPSVIHRADHEDTFHYIDPPYFNADMGHYGGYRIGDFESLLQLLTSIKGRFMLSSYPSDILSAYTSQEGWDRIELDLPRSAGGGRKVEVLTLNYSVNYINGA